MCEDAGVSEIDFPEFPKSPAGEGDDADQPLARVLVLRTGQALSRVHAHCGPFYQLFMRTMNEGERNPRHRVAVDELDMCCRHEDDEMPNLDRYHGAVITGSPAYLDDDESWMRWGIKVVRQLVDADLPTLAVCFGHQLFGAAYGADVGANPTGREMGTVDVAMTDHAVVVDDPLWCALPRSFQAQVTHRDVIRSPGSHLKVIGTAPHDGCHVVKAGPRQWGVQFHPEFDDVTMRLYLEARRDVLDKDYGPGAADKRIANVTVTNQAGGVLRRFAHLANQEAIRRG